ncbi:MAG: MarR family transcriptional regulator [Bacilli bacterium]|nr:MarR family transcriptional regulator [Bacilli bacterium]
MKKDFVYMPLDKQLVFPLYLCTKEVIRRYNAVLEEFDLTYTQFVIMMYLWEKRTSNVKKISETMLLDSSTLTPLLKKLEKKGLIKRNKSLMDERNLSIELTKEGLDLQQKASVAPMKMEKFCKLTKKDEEDFRKLAYKLLINMKEDNKQ